MIISAQEIRQLIDSAEEQLSSDYAGNDIEIFLYPKQVNTKSVLIGATIFRNEVQIIETVFELTLGKNIGAVVPDGGNGASPADVVVASGLYSGDEDGEYDVEVTTGGAFATAELTIGFTPDGGSRSEVKAAFKPVDDTVFAVSTVDLGVNAKVTDGGSDGLTSGDIWVIPVTTSTQAVITAITSFINGQNVMALDNRTTPNTLL